MPDTPSAEVTVEQPVQPVQQPVTPGWDSRAGTQPQGVDYGNPYDPDAPTFSVYRDPVADAQRQREVEEEQRAAAAAKVKGSTYRFLGHPSPYEGTVKVITSGGEAAVGELVKMTDEEFALLTQAGYDLEKVTAAQAKREQEAAASDEGGDG